LSATSIIGGVLVAGAAATLLAGCGCSANTPVAAADSCLGVDLTNGQVDALDDFQRRDPGKYNELRGFGDSYNPCLVIVDTDGDDRGELDVEYNYNEITPKLLNHIKVLVGAQSTLTDGTWNTAPDQIVRDNLIAVQSGTAWYVYPSAMRQDVTRIDRISERYVDIDDHGGKPAKYKPAKPKKTPAVTKPNVATTGTRLEIVTTQPKATTTSSKAPVTTAPTGKVTTPQTPTSTATKTPTPAR